MADDVQNDPYEDVMKHPGKEAFVRLFKAEEYFRVPPKYLFDAWKIDPRNTAVQLIDKMYPRTTHAFDHLIPYTAKTYFDRFYATHDDFPNVLQTSDDTRNRDLFAICCLTISWKLRDKSFFLTEFLRKKNIVYSLDNVREMELEICRGLEWRLRTVTPFLFGGFFIPYLKLPLARSVFHDLIYISQRDLAFTAYRASTIALSAMLAIASVEVSIEHCNYILSLLAGEVHHLKPLLDVIEKCRIRLLSLYPPNDDPPAGPAQGPGPSSDRSTNLASGQTSAGIDDPPAGPALGPGPSSDQSTNLAPGQTSASIDDPPAGSAPVPGPSSVQSTNLAPGQTSASIDDPPAGPASGLGPSSDQSTNLAPGQTSASIDDPPAPGPGSSSAPGQTSASIDDPPAPGPGSSSAPGQTSAGSSGTPPAAATERPRQRPGKEHVTDFGQLQLGGQNVDPNAVAADVNMNDQALVQDAGEIQLAVANQDDQINQITGQVGDEEAEDLKEDELALAERGGRTSIAQKLNACCTIL